MGRGSSTRPTIFREQDIFSAYSQGGHDDGENIYCWNGDPVSEHWCERCITGSVEECSSRAGRSVCTTLIPAVADYDPNAPGIWPPDDPEVFGPLVTPELASMIEEAASLNAALEAEADGKGPLGDGVPWKAYQDDASECTVGAISGSAEHAEVEIEYRYYEEPESGWTDTLLLVRHDDEWRIDDIRFGSPDFDSGLRSVLGAAIDELTP